MCRTYLFTNGSLTSRTLNSAMIFAASSWTSCNCEARWSCLFQRVISARSSKTFVGSLGVRRISFSRDWILSARRCCSCSIARMSDTTTPYRLISCLVVHSDSDGRMFTHASRESNVNFTFFSFAFSSLMICEMRDWRTPYRSAISDCVSPARLRFKTTTDAIFPPMNS